MNIQVSNYGVRSQTRLNLCIYSFLYYFFKVNNFLVLLFYLNLNKKLKTFLKIADYNKFIENLDRIKFC